MSKSGIVVLIIAALVFCGLGFVIGQVVQAAGDLPGSANDPAATQSYVDKAIADRVSKLQAEIEELQNLVAQGGLPNGGSNNGDDPGNNTDNPATKTVTVNADSVNIRASASTSADTVGTANRGDVLTYLSSSEGSDGTWYNVRLSNGTEGYIASWLCSSPQ